MEGGRKEISEVALQEEIRDFPEVGEKRKNMPPVCVFCKGRIRSNITLSRSKRNFGSEAGIQKWGAATVPEEWGKNQYLLQEDYGEAEI